MLLATAVAIITCVTVANATQTITTPNAVKITYNLATGANSAAITPATSTSVLVMGCCTTAAVQGAGQVVLQHIPSAGFSWTGLESAGPSAITSGASATAGDHIVSIDAGQIVDIQVNGIDTIRVHNGAGAARAGNVTLIW
jgi:hypothetical protein